MIFNEQNEIHFFIKTYLSHFILERGTQFVVSLRVRWRDIFREGSSSCPISSSWSQKVPTLAPPCKPYHQRWPNASDQLCIPGLTRFWLDWLSKSDCVVLISRSRLPVTHLLNQPTPTHCHRPCLLITTWQLVKAYGVTRNKPKIHVNSHWQLFSLSECICSSVCVCVCLCSLSSIQYKLEYFYKVFFLWQVMCSHQFLHYSPRIKL